MSAVVLDKEGDRIVLYADARLKEQVKQVPGGRYVRKEQRWVYPLSVATCVIARGVFGNSLEVKPALKEWAVVEFGRVSAAIEARGARA